MKPTEHDIRSMETKLDRICKSIQEQSENITKYERRKKIVVIDDNEEWCDLIKARFMDQGEDIITVSHSFELGKVVVRNDIKAVLIDLYLGGTDGFKILEMLGGEKFAKILVSIDNPESIPENAVFISKSKEPHDFVREVLDYLAAVS